MSKSVCKVLVWSPIGMATTNWSLPASSMVGVLPETLTRNAGPPACFDAAVK